MSGSLIRSLGIVFMQGKLVLLDAMKVCKGSECMPPIGTWLVYVNINTVMCI
jgi:hypothetical protein